MKVQQPSLRVLRLGAFDLGREHVSDVQRSFGDYHPAPFKVVAGGALLTLGMGLVAMDLVRRQPLRAWWYGELARRGKMVQQATVPKRAQDQAENHSHGLAS